MPNRFLAASIGAIKRNGALCTYTKVTTGVYNVELGSVANTTVNYSVWAYRKHVRATQYSYPNLIGKDSGIFYIANDALLFTPAPKDKILWEGQTYVVDSYEAHMAHNQVVLYRVVASRN